MKPIEVRPLRTRRERRMFLTFPWEIYRNDPLWVPPLIPERAKAIDPKRGTFFKRGVAEFFIAWRDGNPVGTICAAEDKAANQGREIQDCVFGFFDFIEDHAVFDALLSRAIVWARSRGLEALYGPFNLDYEDGYGILVEGRDRPPALMCGHTPPYYLDFMEAYGFQPGRPQNVAFAIQTGIPSYERLHRLADRIRERMAITVRQADFNNWDAEIDNLHRLMNTCLAHLVGHIPWTRDALAGLLQPFKDIADPELILFADVKGETVGFFPGIPNLNEAFIHANGLRRPWDYLKLLWYMRQQPESLAIKSVLVLPEYWNRGVAVLLFDELARRATAKGYKWADLSITSVDNPNTIILAEHLGAEIYKRWQVYRLLL
jgi:GNAT superfamily N-acetyltransferase